MFNRKRKRFSPAPQDERRTDESERNDIFSNVQRSDDPQSSFSIPAYEAELVHGPRAKQAAQSLEVVPGINSAARDEGAMTWNVGDGLIRWGGGVDPTKNANSHTSRSISDHDEMENGWLEDDNTNEPIWVDRYDARLLLDRLPSPAPPEAHIGSPDSAGWSDLSSDAEDIFFLKPDEVEDYRRGKRRRLMEKSREDRLQALRAYDEQQSKTPGQDSWGGADELPDDTQAAFMRKTATLILSSPNSAVLEMRILANHGADPRFAFLRGRWSHSWESIKVEVNAELEKNRVPASSGTISNSLGSLEDYGESEDDQEIDTKPDSSKFEAAVVSTTADLSDEVVKAARRERAKEWARKRRALESEQM